MQTIDLKALEEATVWHEPYDHFLGHGILKPEVIDDLRRDFPEITKTGYLTVDEVALKGKFRTLIEELEGPEVTAAVSRLFGQDLSPFPRLTTIMKRCHPKHGNIHTDGASKVMTMLVYLNEDWAAEGGGRLRVLRGKEAFEPFDREVPPTMGTVFGFLRADNSWHGHLPFDGERRVVQIAWIRSKDDVERKRRNNRVAQFLKGIFRH